jgi:hypothetical protein
MQLLYYYFLKILIPPTGLLIVKLLGAITYKIPTIYKQKYNKFHTYTTKKCFYKRTK